MYTIIYGKDIASTEFSATDKVAEGLMYHDKKEGIWKSYFNSGNIKSISEFKKGVPNGKFQKFYENGKLRERGCFLHNHFTDSLFRYYQNGCVESITVYNEKGEENGISKYFHENGNTALIYEKKENKIENKITWFREDGELKHQVESTAFGRIKSLFENENSFALENSFGKKKVYSLRIAGPITKDNPFNPNGYNIIYTKNDEIFEEGEFSNGAMVDGKLYQYDENGLLNQILIYKTGKFIAYGQISKK